MATVELLSGRWSSTTEWRPRHASGAGSWREQSDPGTGRTIARVADQDKVEVEAHIAAVRSEYWTSEPIPVIERARLLRDFADLVQGLAPDLSELDSLCTGKLRELSKATAASGSQILRYYADLIEQRPLGELIEPIAAGAKQRIDRLPVGVIGCILPWNFPLSQACARLAMLFGAGNAAIFKGSELAQPPLLALEQLADEAGLPGWAFSVITGGADAGRALVESKHVDGLCFTGGVATGVEIACESARSLKRLVLELGGRTPNVYFADAMGERAVRGAVAAGFGFQGQACNAGAQLMIEASGFDEFVAAVADRASHLRVGHQLSFETEFGPVISEASLTRIEEAVADAVDRGATVLTGGNRLHSNRGGHYYAPTVLTGVSPDSTLAREEAFGPVVVAQSFTDESELIQRINASAYGLAAAVWGRDLGRIQSFATQLRVGVVYVNCHGPIAKNAPWGGFRMSGLGRLYGEDGLFAFTEARQTYQSLESL